ISTLPRDFYHHVEARHSLEGERWGRVYRLGDRLQVRLVEAEPMTGGLILALDEPEDGEAGPGDQDGEAPLPGRPARRTPTGRKTSRKKPQKRAKTDGTGKKKVKSKGSTRASRKAERSAKGGGTAAKGTGPRKR
ncbi:MAG: hypothetical protein RLN99_04855, partial [Kiloniellaceae bacterium]